MSNDNMEPDSPIPTDAQAAKARSSDELLGGSSPSSSSPRPQHKPTPPESGGTANSMNRLMNAASNAIKNAGETTNVSDLKVDHPYGDSGHGMGTSNVLNRLGAGTPYGK